MKLLAFTALLFARPAAAAETMLYKGETRSYIVRAPADAPRAERLPLVLVFHGGGGTADGMTRLSRFDSALAARRMLVVYPQGVKNHWNDRKEQRSAVDDIGFISALIDKLVAERGVDPKRVFATGMSNGGLFSFRLACELSGKIAAIAPVAANLGEDLSKACAPSKPISMLNIVGDKDPLVPFAGGKVSGPFHLVDRGRVLSSDATMAFWAAKNGCEAAPLLSVDKDARSEEYACKGGAALKRIVVLGGGHAWPGGSQYLPRFLIGKATKSFDASAVIAAFFAGRSR